MARECKGLCVWLFIIFRTTPFRENRQKMNKWILETLLFQLFVSFICFLMLFLDIISRFSSSFSFPTASCTSSKTFVSFYMAGRKPTQCNALWQGGGVHQLGDRDRSRASEHQPESSTSHEPASKGEEFILLLYLQVTVTCNLHRRGIYCTSCFLNFPHRLCTSALHSHFDFFSHPSWFWSFVEVMPSTTCTISRSSWTTSMSVALN